MLIYSIGTVLLLNNFRFVLELLCNFCKFRFRSVYGQLTHADIKGLNYPTIDERLEEKEEEVLKLCKSLLKEEFVRGDYKELVKMVILYLSKGTDTDIEDFIRPGALHKARWMSKLLYTAKIELLSKKITQELPKGAVFAAGQQQKVKRFVQFFVFCYVSWWLTAPVPATAPLNDLILINNLINYRKIDKPCADAAIKAFAAHLWYLTEELVPLALFSSQVDSNIKVKMVHKLTNSERKLCTKRHGTGFGKPAFPIIPQETSDDLDLSQFIGVDSWSFFEIMRLDKEFLHKPISDWESDPGFVAGKEKIHSLSVVNDGAERGVKLAHDFLDSARKEGNLQNILQVVENHRHSLPNQRNKKIKAKSWYLKIE